MPSPTQRSTLFPYTTLFRSEFCQIIGHLLVFQGCINRNLPGIRLVPLCIGGCRGDYGDRKSTRLNSSHVSISYAVFCLKKKINEFLISIVIYIGSSVLKS